MTSKGIVLGHEPAGGDLEVQETRKHRHTAAVVPSRLLRFGEVRHRTGLSRSTIWRMERGGMFPKRVKVSVNVVAWREDEVSEWIQSKCS